MLLKCTNRSLDPSSGVMNPYPLSLENHFTVPVAIETPPSHTHEPGKEGLSQTEHRALDVPRNRSTRAVSRLSEGGDLLVALVHLERLVAARAAGVVGALDPLAAAALARLLGRLGGLLLHLTDVVFAFDHADVLPRPARRQTG